MRPDGWQRLLDTNSASGAFVHTAGTRYASKKALLDTGVALFELGQHRGIVAKVIGRGSDASAINIRVYRAHYTRGSNSAVSGDQGIAHIDLEYFGLLVATLSSTRTGVSGSSAMPAADLAADLMTWTAGDGTTTPKGMSDKLIAAHGSINTPSVYAPNNDADDAVLLIPDAFDCDALVFDGDLQANATAWNVLAMRTR